MPRSVALCLVDSANDFQQMMKAEAEAAARRVGIDLDVRFSGHDLAAHLNAVRASLDATPRPAAVLVMPVRDKGLARVAAEAARAGIVFVYLNRTEDDLEEVRREVPGTPVFTVCVDEVETGRIQGRLFRALLPAGGTVLYVQGTMRSLAARDRTAGVLEVLQDDLDLNRLEAGWTAEESRQAVRNWLSIVARGGKRIDLVGCQNDQIAIGVIEALRAVATELKRPELAAVPVVGCDGTPKVGQRMVDEGSLVATVVLPRSAGPAVERVARLLDRHEMPPPSVTLGGTPYASRPLVFKR